MNRGPGSRAGKAVPDLLERFRPPIHARAFWIVQFMVVTVAAFHLVVEATSLRGLLAGVYFVPESLLAIPLVYAALNFGLSGTAATAAWALLLSLPNFVVLESGDERLGSVLHVALIVVVALLVGERVDKERAARERAERSEAALMASEGKYRSLFTSSSVPVLVVDSSGLISDANIAASSLFVGGKGDLAGLHLEDLLGRNVSDQVLRSAGEADPTPVDAVLTSWGGAQVEVRVLSAPFTDLRGQRLLQVIIQDITRERRRQRNLQTFAAHVLDAQEEERKRIARELHDEVMQTLVLLCRKLDEVAIRYGRGDGGATDSIDEVRTLAEGIVEDLRDFTRRLRPPILEDLGLVACLRRMAAELHERTGIQVHVSAELPANCLTPAVELALFRIVQEALHNVERHSMAQRVAIELTCSGGSLKLIVADNGRGFPLDTADLSAYSEEHLGLIGMNERAQAVGGRLQIKSKPGKGTKVLVTVPLASLRGAQSMQVS